MTSPTPPPITKKERQVAASAALGEDRLYRKNKPVAPAWEGTRLAALGPHETRMVAGRDHVGAALVELINSGRDLGLDIETSGVRPHLAREIKVITFGHPGLVIALDPRDSSQAQMFRQATDYIAAHQPNRKVFLHNAPFDIPLLNGAKLVNDDFVENVCDTLVLARMVLPGNGVKRDLTVLVNRFLNLQVDTAKDWHHSLGFNTTNDWYLYGDIDIPAYLRSAMLDTAVLPELWDRLWAYGKDFLVNGHQYLRPRLDAEGAKRLMNREQIVNRVMLRGIAHGFLLDTEYYEGYVNRTEQELANATALLESNGIRPGQGIDLVTWLEKDGKLPSGWKRTATGRLSATKNDLKHPEVMGHPLVKAFRSNKDITKMLGDYLAKLNDYAAFDGRVHPQTAVLGAATTGRMCIPTTHMLVTERGIIPIGDVRVGVDRTRDHHGEWTTVRKVHRYLDQMVTRYRDGKVHIEATDEHRWVQTTAEGERCVGPITTDTDTVHLVATVPEYVQVDTAYERGHAARTTQDDPAAEERYLLTCDVHEAMSWLHGFAAAQHMVVRDTARIHGAQLTTAVRIAAHRSGWTATWCGGDVVLHTPAVKLSGAARSRRSSDVWCVTTDYGTFTAWDHHMGAYTTGNSAGSPPVQQFPADARPMVLADDPGGWVSIDWSAVEPLVASYAAGENALAHAITHEGDAYVPVAKLAKLIPEEMPLAEAKNHPGRKSSKVVMLGLLYGKGKKLLAEELGVDEDEAEKIKQAVLSGVPFIGEWMDLLRSGAVRFGNTVTAAGRILPVGRDERGKFKGYLAQNYFHQGSAYDCMADAIVTCHEQGLASHIRIAVHDELVTTAEAAPDVERIMQRATQSLAQFTRRDDLYLPTDSNPLVHHWEKV